MEEKQRKVYEKKGRASKLKPYKVPYYRKKKAKDFVPALNFPTGASFIKIPQDKIPVVFVNQQALQDMLILVDECELEVGWLGKVFRKDNEFYFEEIYLLDQEVNSVTTELSKNGQEKLFLELINKPDGLELVNRIRFWGHSHVHMSTVASFQDENKILELAEDAEDYFIQGIFNKLGQLSFNILLVPENLKFTNIPWKTSGVAVYTKTERRKYWKKEIKAKVKENVFVSYQEKDWYSEILNSYPTLTYPDSYEKGEPYER